MDQSHKDVRATAQMLLNKRLEKDPSSLTTAEIVAAIKQAAAFYGYGAIDVEVLCADLEASYQTIIGSERALTDNDKAYQPWLDKRKAEIPWRFWDRYQQYLLQEKRWPSATLARLEATTDRVLGLLVAPDQPGGWDRRGMVVGHVQSGKTSNYVGLIAKAADAGYKLIVVLAGFHKSLRTQTQIRLEEGFLGYFRTAQGLASGPAVHTGVGLLDPRPKADTITTRADDGDFKSQVAKNFAINPGGNPLLFVVKKNGSVLGNLLKWVEWAANARDGEGNPYVSGVPLLVIDDEADVGSIDTRDGAFNEDGTPDPDHDPTVLNWKIRRLLKLFDQSAYVGYTATPFANIFIHEKAATKECGEDLFPRSFIVALPTPSNHIGPAEVFGLSLEGEEPRPGLPIVRFVNDHASSGAPNETHGWMPPKHNTTHVPLVEGQNSLPRSLAEALRAFILACAARIVRGQANAHNSMLIHVTRFTAVQGRVAEQVRSELIEIQRRLRYGEGAVSTSIRSELRDLWERDFNPTSAAIRNLRNGQDGFFHVWGDIEQHLELVALSIRVREINGEVSDVLDYVNHEATGLNVVAIGGDKLSRGLTLEGLTVSYFLRASKMYDTLMQMGRWFGFRPGYLDVCRLYTTPDLAEWFTHIAAASEELRQDFNRMAAIRATPVEFGHRVRSHPLMIVTSQVKMRHGTKISITFDGDISETINFWRTKPRLDANWQATEVFTREVERKGISAEHPEKLGSDSAASVWRGVPGELVAEFLSSYREHDASRKVKSQLLADYVRFELAKQRLTSWTVLLASGASKKPWALGGARFDLVDRSWHLSGDKDEEKLRDKAELIGQNHYRIRRLLSPVDEMVDLDDDQRQKALDATVAAWVSDNHHRGDRPTRPSGPQLRSVRPDTQGLLMLYLLNPADGDEIGSTDKVQADARAVPVVGFGVSFPKVKGDDASEVEYVVNNVYYQQEFGDRGG